MLNFEETIVAVATPPGQGGIGIVRLSGPRAGQIGRMVFRPARPEMFKERRLTYGWAVRPGAGQIVDEVLAVFMEGPGTYTGQDVFEIQAHGGPLVLSEVLGSCLEAGARPAGPGEFTWRAFMSGRIDLTQAEAVAELVAARTKAGARLAVRQLSGRLSDPCQAIVDSALDITAQVEAGVDFPEEDLEAAEFGRLAADLRDKVLKPLKGLIQQAQRGRPLREGIRVVLAGRPNVGKSSLFNALLGRPRALVFTEPGTTRDYLEEMIELEGLPVVLTDTAGLRNLPEDGEERPETAGMANTLELALEAGLILLVVAADEGFSQADQELPSQELAERTVLVVNKSDLVSGQEADRLAKSLSGRPGVVVSAKTGQGLDDLRDTIRAELVRGGLEPEELSCLPNLRQEEALVKAREAFESALKSLEQGRPAELVGVDLREGLDQMGLVTGQTAPDAVLERIFSQFCVGK